MDKEVKREFSFRSARKLSSYLVSAKLYLTERTARSYEGGGKRCETCVNVNEITTFTITVTGET